MQIKNIYGSEIRWRNYAITTREFQFHTANFSVIENYTWSYWSV